MRRLGESGAAGVVMVFIFTVALAGFMYTVLNGVLGAIIRDIIGLLPGGSSNPTYSFLDYVWTFMPLFILIVSGLWLLMQLQKRRYREVGQ